MVLRATTKSTELPPSARIIPGECKLNATGEALTLYEVESKDTTPTTPITPTTATIQVTPSPLVELQNRIEKLKSSCEELATELKYTTTS